MNVPAGNRRPFDDVVDRLFPPFVRGILAPTAEGGDSPYPEERTAVAGAGARRRREFLSGRACAHAALAALGCDDGHIGVGPQRQPVWPTGVVGSISHAGDWSGAVVAASADARGLGFDIEVLDPPLTPDVERLVQTPAERAATPEHPLHSYRSKVVFSAKESVYKCLFPPTGWRLGFDDVTIEVDLAAGRYTARLDPRFSLAEEGLTSLAGRLLIGHGYLFTGLCLFDEPAVTE